MRKRWFIIPALLVSVGAAICTYSAIRNTNEAAAVARFEQVTATKSYSTYNFGDDNDVIDIGVQPLWLPACVISAAMERDQVLKDVLAELGMTARFHPFLKGSDVNAWLLSGHLEAGIGGDMPALSAASLTNTVVATLMQQGFCSIVGRRPFLVGELRGKRIAYAFGSNAHFALLNTLAKAGISEDEVELVSAEVHMMPYMLANKTIDAFSAWEPTPSIALKHIDHSSSVQRSLSTGYMYFSGTFANENRAAMLAVVASQVRSIRWMRMDRRNLEQACRWAIREYRSFSGTESPLTLSEYVNLSLDDLLGRTSSPLIPQEDLADDGHLSREFRFLKSLGKVPLGRGWDEVKACFRESATHQVISSPEKYKLNELNFGGEISDGHG